MPSSVKSSRVLRHFNLDLVESHSRLESQVHSCASPIHNHKEIAFFQSWKAATHTNVLRVAQSWKFQRKVGGVVKREVRHSIMCSTCHYQKNHTCLWEIDVLREVRERSTVTGLKSLDWPEKCIQSSWWRCPAQCKNNWFLISCSAVTYRCFYWYSKFTKIS